MKQHAVIVFLTAEKVPPIDIIDNGSVYGEECVAIIGLHVFMMGSLNSFLNLGINAYWHNH
jgi:hypothetical protein